MHCAFPANSAKPRFTSLVTACSCFPVCHVETRVAAHARALVVRHSLCDAILVYGRRRRLGEIRTVTAASATASAPSRVGAPHLDRIGDRSSACRSTTERDRPREGSRRGGSRSSAGASGGGIRLTISVSCACPAARQSPSRPRRGGERVRGLMATAHDSVPSPTAARRRTASGRDGRAVGSVESANRDRSMSIPGGAAGIGTKCYRIPRLALRARWP